MNPETDSLDYMKSRVREAVEDQLHTAHAKIDLRAASDAILAFVFRNVDAASLAADHNRYEWYYTLLGKSIAVAQGWKQNKSAEVKDPAQTKTSVDAYIAATYGVKI